MRVQVPGAPMARPMTGVLAFCRSPSTGSTSAADRAVPTSLTTAQRSRRSRYVPGRSGGIASNQCWDAMTCVGEPPPQPVTRCRQSASTSM